MPAAASWVQARSDGVRLTLKVTPRAGADAVRGVEIAADGSARLAVRVTAAPDAGKANAAVLRLLAKRWRVPARDLHLVAGASGRRKVVHLDGEAAELISRLEAIETVATTTGRGARG
jgi:uncharacterized protein (TIGR00251 family)